MKRFLAAVGVAVLLWGAGASQAGAQPFPRQGSGNPGKGGPPPYGQPIPARQAERPSPPERPPAEQRMSPEERRQLRRDIEQHGREIYPDPRRDGRR